MASEVPKRVQQPGVARTCLSEVEGALAREKPAAPDGWREAQPGRARLPVVPLPHPSRRTGFSRWGVFAVPQPAVNGETQLRLRKYP